MTHENLNKLEPNPKSTSEKKHATLLNKLSSVRLTLFFVILVAFISGFVASSLSSYRNNKDIVASLFRSKCISKNNTVLCSESEPVTTKNDDKAINNSSTDNVVDSTKEEFEDQLTGYFYIGPRAYMLYHTFKNINDEYNKETFVLRHGLPGDVDYHEIILKENKDNGVELCDTPDYILISPEYENTPTYLLVKFNCGDSSKFLLLGVNWNPSANDVNEEYGAIPPKYLDFGVDNTYYNHPRVVGFLDGEEILVQQVNEYPNNINENVVYYWKAPISDLSKKVIIDGL